MFHKNQEGRYKCNYCDYTSPLRYNMRMHVESKHAVSAGYHCPVCYKFCATTNAFNLHKSRYKHYS